MTQAAYRAGFILERAFNDSIAQEVNKSGETYDVFSVVDTESEAAAINYIKHKLPSINLLSEETGLIDNGSTDTIVIDPLDGSSNFLLGLPHFSVSLAYLHNGEVTASVVYNPILHKMYSAEKGKGAYLNKKRLISHSDRKSLYTSVNFSHSASWEEKRLFFDWAYGNQFSRVLNNWSPNLDYCMLAEGKIDSVVAKGSLIYDFSPGFLIAKESGCTEFPKMAKIKTDSDFSTSFAISNSNKLSVKIYEAL